MKKVHINDDVWNINIGRSYVEMRLQGTNTKLCISKHDMAVYLGIEKEKVWSDTTYAKWAYSFGPKDITYYLMGVHYDPDIDVQLEQNAKMRIPKMR